MMYPFEKENIHYDINSRYRAMIFGALQRTFKGQRYVEFTAAIRIEQAALDGETTPVIEILTHQVDFIGTLRSNLQQLWDVDNPSRHQFQEDLNRDLTDLQRRCICNWKILNKDNEWNAYEVVYDEADCRVSVAPFRELSGSQTDYPEKLRRTSEILQFVVALQSINFVHIDLDECKKFYPMMKLQLDLLDRKAPRFGDFRINTEDYEEWDYINPQADAELDKRAAPV
jgi:hypothetical protein